MNLRKRPLILLILAVTTALVGAKPADAEKLVGTYKKHEKAWLVMMKAAKSPEDKKRLMEQKPDPSRYAKGLIRSFRGETKKPWVVPYIAWILNNCPDIGMDTMKKLRNTFVKHHLRSEGAGEVALALTNFPDRRSLEVIEAVLVKHPDKKEAGQAALAVAYMLKYLGDDPKIKQRRLRMLRQAIIDSAEMSAGNDKTVADVAEEELYRLINLEKGCLAPDFEAQTVSGERVKLSDYRGKKIVVLAFWASQAEASAQTVELLREIQKRVSPEHFVLLGISPDKRDFQRKLIADGEVTWPSISDEEQSLSRKYRIERYPYCYVLDQRGEIRHLGVANSFVSISAEALVAELEKQEN